MNGKVSQTLVIMALVLVAVASMADAHKKFYSQPQFEPERCICDCGGPQHQPILPNKPYHGSGGYAQPRPSHGGYGNAGAYAVSGSYGSGGSQVSGGY